MTDSVSGFTIHRRPMPMLPHGTGSAVTKPDVPSREAIEQMKDAARRRFAAKYGPWPTPTKPEVLASTTRDQPDSRIERIEQMKEAARQRFLAKHPPRWPAKPEVAATTSREQTDDSIHSGASDETKSISTFVSDTDDTPVHSHLLVEHDADHDGRKLLLDLLANDPLRRQHWLTTAESTIAFFVYNKWERCADDRSSYSEWLARSIPPAYNLYDSIADLAEEIFKTCNGIDTTPRPQTLSPAALRAFLNPLEQLFTAEGPSTLEEEEYNARKATALAALKAAFRAAHEKPAAPAVEVPRSVSPSSFVGSLVDAVKVATRSVVQNALPAAKKLLQRVSTVFPFRFQAPAPQRNKRFRAPELYNIDDKQAFRKQTAELRQSGYIPDGSGRTARDWYLESHEVAQKRALCAIPWEDITADVTVTTTLTDDAVLEMSTEESRYFAETIRRIPRCQAYDDGSIYTEDEDFEE
nr:hypothetical protein B0A51_15497 [Rachicladosporium sp. CCFEE 5018]